MLVLTGPPGSGKSAFLLSCFRAAVLAGRSDMRLLVPTATLAGHLRHQQARAGLIFQPELIQTFSRFSSSLAQEVQTVSRPLFHVMVDDALRRVAPAEFARVSDAPGFAASVAQTIDLLDAAGCNHWALAGLRSDAPVAPALGLVWQQVEAHLAARGLVTRTGLLRRAAERVAQSEAGELQEKVKEIWFEGFTAFSDPELALLAALAKRHDLILTLPSDAASSSTRDRLHALGADIQELAAPPAREIERVRFAADSIEREAEEIARRILGSGRAFREIGVALRNPDRYAGLLQSVFERFGIPSRSYFTSELVRNPAAAYPIATIDAMLSGWEHGQCLTALRLAPGNASSPAMDRLDFELRAQLPGYGLAQIRDLARRESMSRVTDEWEVPERWRGQRRRASHWARELAALSRLFVPVQIEEAHAWDRVLMHRSQGAALEVFESALDEAARWWNGPQETVSLDEFWRVAKAIFRLTPVRVNDGRANVVHVMSIYEARQWDLAMVFLCGLAEKEFPRRHPQNSLVPDAAIRRLQRNGVRAPSSQDRDAEELSLFHSVSARAGQELVLSYAREEQNLPSEFWLAPGFREENPRLVRPAEQPRKYTPRSGIASADLLPVLHQRSAELSVTALENYLQCAFRFLGRNILNLKPAPPRPEDRLDALQQGNVVHSALADWYRERPPIGPLFDARFHQKCDELRVPMGYRTEVLRRQMRAALERFEHDDRWPRGNPAELEWKATINLGDGIVARARLDRLETLPNGSLAIVDYKYSNAANTKKKVDDETLLQGKLYVAGASKAGSVSAMVYYNVRTDPGNQVPKPYGWGVVPGLEAKLNRLDQAWMDGGIAEARRAVAEFRSGRVLARPTNPDACGFCDFRDACRWEVTAAIALAGQ